MEIKRFGDPAGKTIMLLHGNLMCWRQFEDVIPLLNIMPQKQYRTAREKTMPAWALRFMGQTEQGMNTMLRRIPDNISLESVRATWEVGLYLYRTSLPPQPEAAVACWYGEKEGHMKKALRKLRAMYPRLAVRCFSGFGHGDIINHPELLAAELEQFLNGVS